MPKPTDRIAKLRLQVAIVESGKSIGEISKASGLDVRTLYELRTRRYRVGPDAETLTKLADILNLTIGRLRELVMEGATVIMKAMKNRAKA